MPEPVGEEREVEFATVLLRDPDDLLNLIDIERAGFPQRAANQRRLAVVHRANHREPEQFLLTGAASEIPFPLLEFHRRFFVVIDEPAPPLRGTRRTLLFDDFGDGVCGGLHRAAERVTAEGSPQSLRSTTGRSAAK